MSVKALSEYTRYAKYSRYLPEKKRRETWPEQVDRVFDMHKTKLGDKYDLIKDEFEFAKESMLKKKVLGSQRALQFGGSPVFAHQAKLFNCSASYADRVRIFQEVEYLLLCGCGVGISVQKHHVAKLPKIANRTKGKKTYVVEDSIEGWADAIGVLVSSYFTKDQTFTDYIGYEVEFDFSKIRPEGAPISWGGVAPGPKGLKNAVSKITQIFDSCLAEGRDVLKSIEIYDILMHESDSVLSGGIRRSATIILFSPDDEEMVKAKTGDWFIKNPQRGRSNNSAVLVRSETSKEQFAGLMQSVRDFGEPGFLWVENKEVLYNPCLTDDMWVTTSKGPKQIKELINTQFTAIVNGKPYESTSIGFYETGSKEVFCINTEEGISVKATENHKFLTVGKNGQLQWEEVSDIKPGTKLALHEHKEFTWQGEGSFAEGWLLGSLKGDGNIEYKHKIANLEYWGNDRIVMTEHVKTMMEKANIDTDKVVKGVEMTPTEKGVSKIRVRSKGVFELSTKYLGENKTLLSSVEKASSDFYKGFLQGWFDSDGSPQGTKAKGQSIRLSSTDYEGLCVAQRMLLRMGIKSKVYKERRSAQKRLLPDGKGGKKAYDCKAVHELIISRSSIKKFAVCIGFAQPYKAERLAEICDTYTRKMNKDKFEVVVSSIDPVGVEKVYDCTIPNAYCFDANGLISHNCVEISLYGYDEFGNSGFEFCNLTTINVRKAKNEEEFLESCRASAIIGTIQASYDSYPYMGEVTERIVRREALLGCSMTGIMDNPDIALNPELQRKGAELIKKTNKEIAAKIGINPAARTTCIKPEGSASCLLGSSSGIHPQHAKRYIRRVQANKNEFPVNHFKMFNPRAVEESVWSANKTDYVISFLCEVPDGARLKNSMEATELLKNVQLTQQNWVEYGTNEDLSVQPWLRHNVSNTISVQKHEWDAVTDYIYENRAYFAGISLLPASGDLDYPQAPFTTVLSEKEIVKEYGEGTLFASGLIVDGLASFDNNLWTACDAALGLRGEFEYIDTESIYYPVKPKKNGYTDKQFAEKLQKYAGELAVYYEQMEAAESNNKKVDWIRRFKQFANRYVDGDKRKCTHLLKHIHNWKLWLDLKREYSDIDWSAAVEEKFSLDVSSLGGEACAGGACEVGELGAAIKAAG